MTVIDRGGISSLHRLKLRCKIDELTDCWIWSMSTYAKSGLPIVHARYPWEPDVKHKTTGRRAALQFKIGKPLGRGWFVWSTCGNSACCNPDHAEFGDTEAFGEAARRYGWHKNSPAHVAANRKNVTAQRRLTEQQANEIRLSSLSIAKLAAIYGVGKTTIADIKRGVRYRQNGVANSSVFAWRPAA